MALNNCAKCDVGVLIWTCTVQCPDHGVRTVSARGIALVIDCISIIQFITSVQPNNLYSVRVIKIGLNRMAVSGDAVYLSSADGL